MKRPTCPECGRTGGTVRRVDAAGVEHQFHVRCAQTMTCWLRGHDLQCASEDACLARYRAYVHGERRAP